MIEIGDWKIEVKPSGVIVRKGLEVKWLGKNLNDAYTFIQDKMGMLDDGWERYYEKNKETQQ